MPCTTNSYSLREALAEFLAIIMRFLRARYVCNTLSSQPIEQPYALRRLCTKSSVDVWTHGTRVYGVRANLADKIKNHICVYLQRKNNVGRILLSLRRCASVVVKTSDLMSNFGNKIKCTAWIKFALAARIFILFWFYIEIVFTVPSSSPSEYYLCISRRRV